MSELDLNLGDLRAFVQVVESGGFTAAGLVLGRSTKQISRQIQRLEGHVGAELLLRTTRAVSPTDLGARFYEHAVRVLDELADARMTLAPGDGELGGTLRVVLPSLASVAGLPAWLRELRESHPGLAVQVRLSDRPRDLVAEGFDLQIIAARPTQTTLVIRRLLTLAAPLAAHESYLLAHGKPKTPAELAQHECLRFSSGPPQEQWHLVGPNGKTATVNVVGQLQSDNSEVLCGALHEGLGVGLCGAGYLRAGGHGLVRVLEGWTFESLSLYAVMPRSSRKSAAVAAFVDTARRGIAAWAS